MLFFNFIFLLKLKKKHLIIIFFFYIIYLRLYIVKHIAIGFYFCDLIVLICLIIKNTIFLI